MRSLSTDLFLMVPSDEKIFWQSKPNKNCFILECIFNPLLPFAIIWAAFDFFFLYAALNGEVHDHNNYQDNPTIILYIFLLIHATPIWIYLAGVLLSFRKYMHTEFIITDKAVYISGGSFSISCKTKKYKDICEIEIHRGFLDQFFGVGDIVLHDGNDDEDYSSARSRNKKEKFAICDIADYREVFELVKKLQKQSEK